MNSNQSTTTKGPEAEPARSPKHRSWLWRAGRFCLLGLATLVTLFVLFHIEETWRGKRAWRAYKATKEAQGVVFDIKKLAPPPVPDDQNFAMTPLLRPLLDLYPAGSTNASPWRDEQGKQHVESIRLEDPNLDLRLDIDHSMATGEVASAAQLAKPDRANWRLGEAIRLDEWQAYYRASEVFPSWPEPRSPGEDVLKALSRYDAELNELHEASRRPYARFNIHYEDEDPFAIMLSHLSALRSLSRVLQLHAVAAMEAGEGEAALEDVNLMFTLADSIKQEPTLVSHLVRLALLDVTTQTVWEGLNRQCWSEVQLAQLQGKFAGADLIAEMTRSFEAERAFGSTAIDMIMESPETAFQLTEPAWDRAGGRVFARLTPAGWFCFEAVNYNRFFDDHLLSVLPDESGGLDLKAIRERSQQFLSDLGQISTVRAFFSHQMFTKLLMPALDKVPIKSIQAEALRGMAETAIALERYRLAKGNYPESLSSLSPQWVATVPNDPIAHQPYHYSKDGDASFRLWSVGWNDHDDGGEVAVKRTHGRDVFVAEDGDWVWPQTKRMRLKVTEE